MGPREVIFAAWALWALSWFAAATWSSRTEARPPLHTVILDRTLTVAGALLLFASRPDAPLHSRLLWQFNGPVGWVLVAIAIGGFAFCWWARIYLGRLWSGNVTRKHDHHIVDTGPYRFVRHPIYTGLIIAAFATAAAIGSAGSLEGAALISLGWYFKARVEERFLRAELGAQAYDAYARKTAMLVPFVKI